MLSTLAGGWGSSRSNLCSQSLAFTGDSSAVVLLQYQLSLLCRSSQSTIEKLTSTSFKHWKNMQKIRISMCFSKNKLCSPCSAMFCITCPGVVQHGMLQRRAYLDKHHFRTNQRRREYGPWLRQSFIVLCSLIIPWTIFVWPYLQMQHYNWS